MKELSLHLLDIIQNSVRAQAHQIKVSVDEQPNANRLTLTIEDDGMGIPEVIFEQVTNPFITTRTLRKVGLGLPFLSQLCQECAGELKIVSEEGKGTCITATMEYNHIDRLPIGDMASTMHVLIMARPDIHYIYVHKYQNNVFLLDTEEVKKMLEGVPIEQPEILEWIKGYIETNIETLYRM
ncbi:MAG: ATP-binding protein [Niameybacter sp.]|uniref:ATP-binding protein n=1 Tax=Niameybacter sp. TaxID=2033640 RepID=UPI002FCA6365